MAADIKNYLKEKEKRQKNQDDYKKKIRKHKLTIVYRVLLVAAALGAALALVVVQAKRHIYTGYDTVSSVNRETSSDAIDVRLKNGILTYSKDGAHCTDAKGNVKWNQTYVIQDVKLATCGSVAAIGSYNGREIYVQNTEKQLGTITTTMPIRNITVADTGRVTATLADTDVTWIMTYEADGSNSYTGQAHMNDGGYPISISLSPSGELLAVSYLYVDAGVVKSNVVFYNFGPVGANQSDYMVSAYTYSDLVVPKVQFMNNDTAFAAGDSRLMIFSGSQKPVTIGEYLYDDEIQSVFYSGDSEMGTAVADYALQFVGNPYVYGGSSLTNGTDCSGFVMSVYANFGVSLPHSSSADRSQGAAVDGLANAQAGDLICYSGHVALYIGNGQIVHASTAKTCIIVSNADYKKVLAVRRIF